MAYPSSPQVVYVQSPSNGLGVAAFVCSLVGLISCGLFAPVGLALSIPAMFRQPRGLAIAALILGILGSFWLIVVFVIFGSIFAALAALLAVVGVQIGTYAEMAKVNVVIQEYKQRTGALPADLSALSGLTPDELTDPWGHAYRYVLSADGKSFELRCDGPDGKPQTDDDIVLPQDAATGTAPPAPAP